MSIFIPHICQVCKVEIEEPRKRCARCERRYDANGVAYVIYCDFLRFTKPGPSAGSGQAVTFWVADGKVQRTPAQYEQLMGKTDEEAVSVMCAEGFGMEIWAAQVKDDNND